MFAALTLHVAEWFSVGVSPLMSKAGFFFMEQIVTGQSSHALQPTQAYHTHCLASLSPAQSHSYREWEE